MRTFVRGQGRFDAKSDTEVLTCVVDKSVDRVVISGQHGNGEPVLRCGETYAKI